MKPNPLRNSLRNLGLSLSSKIRLTLRMLFNCFRSGVEFYQALMHMRGDEKMSTHDFSDPSKRCWGHDYHITKIHDQGTARAGLRVSLCGWSYGIKVGDYLLLQNGRDSTRYLIESVRYESNPPDMWFVEATFAPRECG